MKHSDIVTLQSDRLSLGLDPGFGGSIAFWRDGKEEIFCSTSAVARQRREIMQTGCFPLVPFSNRIANSAFNWRGGHIELQPNLAGHKRSIHGLGFVSSWAIDQVDEQHAVLTLVHKADARWPWSFSARQQFELAPQGFCWSISMTNDDQVPQPAGLGFHPYFKGQDAMLEFSAENIWQNGPDLIPVGPTAIDEFHSFSPGKVVNGHQIDNCYQGWDGQAQIFWPSSNRRLEISSSAHHAVLYIPPGENRFCFEPVNHINNALNLDHEQGAMPALEPGETARLDVTLKLS